MADDTQKLALGTIVSLRASLDAAIEQRNQALLERDALNAACAELRQRYTTGDLQRQMETLTRERDTAVRAAQRAQDLLLTPNSSV